MGNCVILENNTTPPIYISEMGIPRMDRPIGILEWFLKNILPATKLANYSIEFP